MKRWLLVALLLLIGCVGCSCGTHFITRWLYRNESWQVSREAKDFPRYKDAFIEFVRDRELADGERIEQESLPQKLRGLDIRSVYRKGLFVHFVLPDNGLNADGTGEFVYTLDRQASIEELTKSTKRSTVHAQRLYDGSEPWIYWMHRPNN